MFEFKREWVMGIITRLLNMCNHGHDFILNYSAWLVRLTVQSYIVNISQYPG